MADLCKIEVTCILFDKNVLELEITTFSNECSILPINQKEIPKSQFVIKDIFVCEIR